MKKDILAIVEILKEIFCILNSKQKVKSFLILLLIIVGSALEMLSVSAILPFVQAIIAPDALLNNPIFGQMARLFQLKSKVAIVCSVGLMLCAVYIFKNIFLSIISYLQIRFRWQMQKELSTTMLSSYMNRPYSYFLDTNSSEVLRGIQEDVNSLYTVIENLFLCFSNILTLLFISIFLCISDFSLAITILIIAGVCFGLITFKFRKILSGVGQKQREANAEEKKYAYQAVIGIKEINVLQRKGYFVKKYQEAYEKSMRANVKFFFLNTLPNRVIEAVCISGIIMFVCLRYDSGVVDTIFISKMATFVVAAFKILPLIAALIATENHLVYYWAGVGAIYNNIVRNSQTIEENTVKGRGCENDISMKTFSMRKYIKIQHISWKYPNSEKTVLNDLSMEVYKGESIALIGASGAGKTTLADIILGLYRPQSGKVTVDDVDISTIPKQWSKMIGYVPQQVFLTDDTIRNNIAFGLYENEIDEKMIWNALEKAQLSEFVQSLPEGLNAKVGERGVKFSGGQRQRVAIARALYYDPDILVLDEATSALDNETETAVMESIDLLRGDKTLLIIAHRLSTIENCDKIYEIIGGRAVLRKKEDIIKVN